MQVLKSPRSCCLLFASALMMCSFSASAAEDNWRAYEVYDPEIRTEVIYRGGTGENPTLYNHCASAEWLDGKFYVIWQANALNEEGQPGQALYVSTSEDFANWSQPEKIIGVDVGSYRPASNFIPKQPNLVRVGDELWCVWHAWGGGSPTATDPQMAQQKSSDGWTRWGGGGTSIRLARLKAGQDTWSDEEIQSWVMRDGRRYLGYTSQNPVLLSSGRVVVPVTYIEKDPQPGLLPHRFVAFLYTDDNGGNWAMSEEVDYPGDHNAVWEPHLYEQADGTLRIVVRNMTRSRNKIAQNNILTTTGSGVEKGSVLRMEHDLKPMQIETISERPQVMVPETPGGHFVMLHHDVIANQVVYANRENLAAYFSRSGGDDFVAGTSLTPRGEIASYAQGLLHDGNLYVAYTSGATYEPRSIHAITVSPLPSAENYYIFPRRKEIMDMRETRRPVSWQRHNSNYVYEVPKQETNGAKSFLVVEERGVAGVDTDTCDLGAGEALEVVLPFTVDKMPDWGNLILCSFGDGTPVRVGIPSNRDGVLYVQADEGWVPALQLPEGTLTATLRMKFGADAFSIAVDGGEAKVFQNPERQSSARFYLGDGYEVDFTESNRKTRFLVDLDGFRTRVTDTF